MGQLNSSSPKFTDTIQYLLVKANMNILEKYGSNGIASIFGTTKPKSDDTVQVLLVKLNENIRGLGV